MSTSVLRCRLPSLARTAARGNFNRNLFYPSLLKHVDQWVENAVEPTSKMSPAQYMRETSEAFFLQVELPGIPKDKIKVDRLGDQLKIFAHEEADGITRKYQNIFTLPKNTEKKAIKAESKDGVLTIQVPKTTEAIEGSEKVPVPIH